MCSAYGCGGIVAVAWSTELVPVSVEIDGRGAAGEALALRQAAGSWLRRGRARARDIPATLRAGGVGAVVGWLGYCLVFGLARGFEYFGVPGYWSHAFLPYLSAFLVTGLGYGLLAPFVASVQHRKPVRTALATGAAAFVVYLAAPSTTFAIVSLTALLGTLSAATVGEALFGPYRALGRRLGRAAAPLRYLLTSSIFLVASLAAVQLRGYSFSAGILAECFAWALLAGVAGGHALEIGKEEYRKHLVALVEGPQEPAEG